MEGQGKELGQGRYYQRAWKSPERGKESGTSEDVLASMIIAIKEITSNLNYQSIFLVSNF